ncbi:hypothetical protein DCAR_0102419 [Daucus carota subsp. sativus]|uniref:Uncharacterized protein n=1 Tax=Daucus carota subsp. sativus TaxID=79200 RepID=A0AAF0W6G2_DAUCS|nr:hypothetical protein DCAR_0102419 [Daucus carota subsp. sativus]
MAKTTHPALEEKLEGKVAIITGGASGIGEATAYIFAEHGARAIVIADIQDTLGQRVAKSISGGRCTYKHCDVSDEEQVKELVDSTVEAFGKLDIMFSNAGIMRSSQGNQMILDFDVKASDRIFAINARGMTGCVKHAAIAMVKGGVKGSIVCTGSLLATTGREHFIDYVMSKHAHGIRVNCVSPGTVATLLACSELKFAGVDECEEFFARNSILKGCGVLKAGDVANAVLFLASQDSQFVTGQNIAVDVGTKLV